MFPKVDAAIRFNGISGSLSDSTNGGITPFLTTVSAKPIKCYSQIPKIFILWLCVTI